VKREVEIGGKLQYPKNPISLIKGFILDWAQWFGQGKVSGTRNLSTALFA